MFTMKKTAVFLITGLCLVGFNLFADYQDGKKITVKGTVRLVGNEPFPRLVVTDENKKDFFFPNGFNKSHKTFINKKVEVKGILKIKTIYSADYKYKIIEYQLIKPSIKLLK